MKAAVIVLALLSASPVFAQSRSRVPDIYAEMGRVRSQTIYTRGDLWSRMISDLARVPVVILDRQPYLPPPTFLPPPTPLAYSEDGAGNASCGARPARPARPAGCRGEMVAQCIVDSNGNASWVWVCVTR